LETRIIRPQHAPHAYSYIPILALRVAEMQALEHLPEESKKRLMPAIQLRPWANAKEFEKGVERVEKAYGEEKKWIANLDSRYKKDPKKKVRDADIEFCRLKESTNGYKNWCDFVSHHKNIIPCVQLEETAQIPAQISTLSELGRGLALYLSPETLRKIAANREVMDALERTSNRGTFFIIIDFGEISEQIVRSELHTLKQCFSDLEKLPQIGNTNVVLSGSSFPQQFDSGHQQQPIYERQLYKAAITLNLQEIGNKRNLIYGDHASVAIRTPQFARAWYARIDLVSNDEWNFFKSDTQFSEYETRSASYKRIATRAVESDAWDENLKTWGTVMIKNTKQGGEFPINSPRQNVAARINTHLHLQAFYDRPEERTKDFKEAWKD